jgi:hypothetical protein
MNTLICAGGSGTRVMEAALQLCAAGLGPEKLRILVIDPDTGNGNLARTNSLVTAYSACHGDFGKDTGLFRTELELLPSPPLDTNQRFNQLLRFDLLSPVEKDLVHLFFTDDELIMNMDKGFRGHPALGAAVMALLSLRANQPPWQELAVGIQGDVNTPEGSRVAIAGSVFGGTGAAALHPLALFLRGMPVVNKNRLKIAAVALVPYFEFNVGEADAANQARNRELAAKSEWFALTTRAAVEFYDHLRKTNNWEFDAMYWLGDDGLAGVEYSVGGPEQKNPAHFVDFLGAVAALDFLASDGDAGGCRYAGPAECPEETLKKRNVLRWEDIPVKNLKREKVRRGLLEFYLAGVMHLGFMQPLLEFSGTDRMPYCVPWYLERFASQKDWLTGAANSQALARLAGFFSQHWFPWWCQIHGVKEDGLEGLDRVRLFNRSAMNAASGAVPANLHGLATLAWPQKTFDDNLDRVDSFFSDMVRASGSHKGGGGAASYLALLSRAAGTFVTREYSDSLKEA